MSDPRLAEIALTVFEETAQTVAPLINRLEETAAVTRNLSPVLDGWIPGPRIGSPMAVEVVKMAKTGGSAPVFLGASDGNIYLTKYCGNLQGNGILSNSLLANHAYRFMGITVPDFAVIDVSPQFVERNRGLLPRMLQAGPAFGSKEIVGAVDRTSLCDIRLENVVNRAEFGKVQVMHPFLKNTDNAQFLVVHRASGKLMYTSDLGRAFGGDRNLENMTNFAFLPQEAKEASGFDRADFEDFLGGLRAMPESVLREPLKGLPRQWTAGDLAASLQAQVDEILHPARVDLIGRVLRRTMKW